MGKTSIEWTDCSVNPIRGRLGDNTGHYCEKISPGCKNCYSSRTQPRFRMPVFQDQRRAGVESFFDPKRLQEVLRRKKPTKFFWCDMTDMFGSWVPNEWIAACFAVMAATPHHTHQVLTKRAARLPQWFAGLEKAAEACAGLFPHDDYAWRRAHCLRAAGLRAGVAMPGYTEIINAGWPLPNVHLGVSAEDQATADERIPLLLETPAAVRWVSYEPALAGVDFKRWLRSQAIRDGYRQVLERFPASGPTPAHLSAPGVDWLVVGGESGPGARPFNMDWARSVRDQCAAAGTAFFFKQAGSRPFDGGFLRLVDRKGGDLAELGHWPREFPR